MCPPTAGIVPPSGALSNTIHSFIDYYDIYLEYDTLLIFSQWSLPYKSIWAMGYSIQKWVRYQYMRFACGGGHINYLAIERCRFIQWAFHHINYLAYPIPKQRGFVAVCIIWLDKHTRIYSLGNRHGNPGGPGGTPKYLAILNFPIDQIIPFSINSILK